MAQPIRLGDSQAILTHMENVMAKVPAVPNPFQGATSLDVFKRCVADGKNVLPARYQEVYVNVLEQALAQAEAALKNPGSRPMLKKKAILQQLELVFSALGAPIVQLRSKAYQRELRAFLAVNSDVYRHFVDNRKIRASAKSSLLWPSLDPLGSFSNDRRAGPYTFAASAELPVALISKPAAQTAFLPLWLIDGHEVGGHSIMSGVEGLVAELGDTVEAKIRDAYRTKTVKPSTETVQFAVPTGVVFNNRVNVSMPDFMARLCRQWLSEMSADAAGLLNMGPMFVDGMILALALERPNWELSSRSVFDNRRGFTEHPTDIVRVLLGIEMLKKLGIAKANAYAQAAYERLEEMVGDLPESVVWVTRTGTQAVEMKLSDIQAILPVVADAILNDPLKALSDHSLLSVMPWTNQDEKAVRVAAANLLRGQADVPDYVHARHVVAGSMLAAERATEYDEYSSLFKQLHRTGITILNDMYANQCLLCNIQTLAPRNKDVVKLKDLVRLVKNMRK
jgi:hypothetical protein